MAALAGPAQAQSLPPGFVYLHEIEPGILQDMRYAGSDNFTGRALPGYGAGECVLRRDVALALKRVQAALAQSGLSLKTYDCYRPRRAVAAMARWANDGASGSATKRFYPELDKRTLFAAGYIAARSAHSAGTAVDLTLVKLPPPRAEAFDPAARYAPCTTPATARAPDNSLDMGTGFDCFDARSHTASRALTPAQRQARSQLLAAMRAQGFKNYFREWWHFSYGAGAAPHYDVPIAGRR